MTPTSATQPEIATIAAQGKWIGDVRTQVQIRHFDPVTFDEPTDMGGTDQGPNPMEYVLGALMGCETVLIDMVARERNFVYDGIKYDLSGTLDLRALEGTEGIRPYFKEITGTVRVTTNEDEAKLAEVAKEAMDRSPVYTMLRAAGVKFDVDWNAVRP